MVYRVFTEKKKEFAEEAASLLSDINTLLGICSITGVRVVNRYDAEEIDGELFAYAEKTVFSEPQTDTVCRELDTNGDAAFAVEYLPGQFDQRADSAAQCIQLISQKNRPVIRTAKVYILSGRPTAEEIEAVKKYVINPVESREAGFCLPETLKTEYSAPTTVAVIDGFTSLDRAGLESFIKEYALAMDADDAAFTQEYFRKEGRDPTVTEIRMIDTYWSDHCRHTTFTTRINNITFEDETLRAAYESYLEMRRELGITKPVCLMDMATVAVKHLKKLGKLEKLDESEEINACTVKIKVNVDGCDEDWLLLFKNETHNHPTEIEPFGGAATCIGGAIRDPLSGRAYVYGAMRVTGAADPLKSVSETLPGKLPQRKIVTKAADGYSSYGNQIGLATGIVDEIYHSGYAAKRMEIGAVVGAAPAENVRRERPSAKDAVILIGGSTGRDGCGGATGSSKSHTAASLSTCGAEVQKGNAPEERKLQRLFRNPAVSRMIKRCNDFGAGGVSVAVGELADGLCIDLDAVPKKYEGLDGTELAISESQERMAVVVAPEDADAFIKLCDSENLQAVKIADVTDDERLRMHWRGNTIVDISREFLNSNGAPKNTDVSVSKPQAFEKSITGGFVESYLSLADDLNVCSKRGLSEQFDSTIGAGTVLMPFGGKNQLTPAQAMVQKISVEKKHTDDCSVMAWGFNPYISEKSPYHGAYLAVTESVSKLVASGAAFSDVYLTFQEYFERLGRDPERWGKPVSALLGALEAQKDLNIAAIGGKDSMSGTFENIDVPPTLVSFAVTTEKAENIISPEFKKAGSAVYCISPRYGENGLPETRSLLQTFEAVTGLIRSGRAISCYTPGYGGIAEAVMKMCLGNSLGFCFGDGIALEKIFGYSYASFIVEVPDGADTGEINGASLLGYVTEKAAVCRAGEEISLDKLSGIYENKLESVFRCNIKSSSGEAENFTFEAKERVRPASTVSAKPRVLIPVFPGTNCEYDSAKAVSDAGAEPEIFVINNRTPENISRSVEDFAKAAAQSQIIFIPGGFSGGDEPDGSGKFITAFFRSGAVREQVEDLLERRGGLMCGICNGFQALIKLGLVPYGKICDTDESFPTLTYNTIARHQSKIVRVRVASNMSPWLALTNPGEVYSVPVSHGEGRFIASDDLVRKLAENGQIATQYVDLEGNASGDIDFNPNGSVYAVEGITSPDGRVFGKMGHSERVAGGLYINVPGNYDIKMFKAAVKYFKS